jgi:hypothetical protein
VRALPPTAPPNLPVTFCSLTYSYDVAQGRARQALLEQVGEGVEAKFYWPGLLWLRTLAGGKSLLCHDVQVMIICAGKLREYACEGGKVFGAAATK